MYTRAYAAGAPFRELFEKLSDEFLGNRDEPMVYDDERFARLRTILNEVASNDPSEIPR